MQVFGSLKGTMPFLAWFSVAFWCAALIPRVCYAQVESPYFVTYSSALEEPGNLEIENQNIIAQPKNTNLFYAPTVEFEYGVTGWWTAEAYVQGQSTQNDSTVFTGYRIESRFRPLPCEDWINPVLYVEYENVNGADKSFLEIAGNTTIATFQTAHAQAVSCKNAKRPSSYFKLGLAGFLGVTFGWHKDEA